MLVRKKNDPKSPQNIGKNTGQLQNQKKVRKVKPTIVDWRSNFPEETEETQDLQAAGEGRYPFAEQRLFSVKSILTLLKKLWLPLLAAILVGLAIGLTFIMLVFHNSNSKPLSSVTASQKSVQSVNVAAKADLSLQFYGLQAGVFTNQSGAQTLQQELNAKGIQSFILKETDSRVIIGIGKTASQAQSEAQKDNQKQVSVYPKLFQIPVNPTGQFSNSDKNILVITHQFISKIEKYGFSLTSNNMSSSDKADFTQMKSKLSSSSPKNKNVKKVYNSAIVALNTILSSASHPQKTVISTSKTFLKVMQDYIQTIQ